MPLPLRRTPLNTKNKTNNVKPIVVTDPNDPRLKAYGDSLAIFNASDAAYKRALQEKLNLLKRQEWKIGMKIGKMIENV